MKELVGPKRYAPVEWETSCYHCERRLLVEEVDIIKSRVGDEGLCVGHAICICGGRVWLKGELPPSVQERILALPQNSWWRRLFR